MYLAIGVGVIALIVIIVLSSSLKTTKRKLEKVTNGEIEKISKEYKREKENYENYKKAAEEQKGLIDETVKQQEQIVKEKVAKYCTQIRATGEAKAKEEIEQKRAALNQELETFKGTIEEQKAELLGKRLEVEAELATIKEELEDFRSRRAAINEANRLENELKLQADAHRILLDGTELEDIEFLMSIEHKVHNKEVLHKLIWTEYLQRPFNQMIKNLFGANIPKNVIYCIENLNTHQKYIGKTTAEVSKRWTEHVKSSLNISTISHQPIHDALLGQWSDFAFSIIEEVDAESKVSDREKYYIKLYESDKYGYNAKAGG